MSPSLASFEHDDCARLAATGPQLDRCRDGRNAERGYRATTPIGLLVQGRVWSARAIARQRDAVVVLGVNVEISVTIAPVSARGRARRKVPPGRCGFTKPELRKASHALGLSTWDKPAAACLASRLPYGTPVEIGVLASVEAAERGLHDLGFRDVRVRHYRDLARVEVPLGDLDALLLVRDQVVEAIKAAGYRYVTVDLEGLRSGNLNAALGLSPPHERR